MGYGASGRNGGWCSALFPASLDSLAALAGPEAALAQHAAMRALGRRGASRRRPRSGIDAHVARGGTVSLIRSQAQLARARREISHARQLGNRRRRAAAARRGRGPRSCWTPRGTLGATYTPDCAAIHPLRLARGLARLARRARGRDPRAHPGHVPRARAACTRRRGASRRARWCGRPRATPAGSPGIAATWRRSTPSSSPRSRCRRRRGSGSGWLAARPSPTTGT